MSTIKSKSEIVPFERDNIHIKVQRMRWNDTRKWLRKLADEVTKFFESTGILDDGKDTIKLTELLKYLKVIIEQSDSLIDDLLVGSCRAVKPEDFGDMDTMEVSALIAAACKVNWDDDLKNCWIGVLNQMSGLFGTIRQTPTKPSKTPMPILYEQDIRPSTSTNAPSKTSMPQSKP